MTGGCGAGRRNRTDADAPRRRGSAADRRARSRPTSILRPDTRSSPAPRRPSRRARRSRSRPSGPSGRRRPARPTRPASRTAPSVSDSNSAPDSIVRRAGRQRHGHVRLGARSGWMRTTTPAQLAFSGIEERELGVEERVADAFGEVAPEVPRGCVPAACSARFVTPSPSGSPSGPPSPAGDVGQPEEASPMRRRARRRRRRRRRPGSATADAWPTITVAGARRRGRGSAASTDDVKVPDCRRDARRPIGDHSHGSVDVDLPAAGRCRCRHPHGCRTAGRRRRRSTSAARA